MEIHVRGYTAPYKLHFILCLFSVEPVKVCFHFGLWQCEVSLTKQEQEDKAGPRGRLNLLEKALPAFCCTRAAHLFSLGVAFLLVKC